MALLPPRSQAPSRRCRRRGAQPHSRGARWNGEAGGGRNSGSSSSSSGGGRAAPYSHHGTAGKRRTRRRRRRRRVGGQTGQPAGLVHWQQKPSPTPPPEQAGERTPTSRHACLTPCAQEHPATPRHCRKRAGGRAGQPDGWANQLNSAVRRGCEFLGARAERFVWKSRMCTAPNSSSTVLCNLQA